VFGLVKALTRPSISHTNHPHLIDLILTINFTYSFLSFREGVISVSGKGGHIRFVSREGGYLSLRDPTRQHEAVVHHLSFREGKFRWPRCDWPGARCDRLHSGDGAIACR
jgi:hypothetical protein